MRLSVHRQYDGAALAGDGGRMLQDFDTFEFLEIQIGNQDVRIQFGQRREQLLRTIEFGDNGHIGFLAEKKPDALTDDGMVFQQDNPYHAVVKIPLTQPS